MRGRCGSGCARRLGQAATPGDSDPVPDTALEFAWGLDLILDAWERVRDGDETLVVAGLQTADSIPGVRFAGRLEPLEYRALLRGLAEAAALGARAVRIQSDSELVVRQLSGRYQVKSPALAPLHREALARLREFDRVSVVHVPRTDNERADALANRALDGADAPSR